MGELCLLRARNQLWREFPRCKMVVLIFNFLVRTGRHCSKLNEFDRFASSCPFAAIFLKQLEQGEDGEANILLCYCNIKTLFFSLINAHTPLNTLNSRFLPTTLQSRLNSLMISTKRSCFTTRASIELTMLKYLGPKAFLWHISHDFLFIKVLSLCICI